jgi:hypothetical protein
MEEYAMHGKTVYGIVQEDRVKYRPPTMVDPFG